MDSITKRKGSAIVIMGVSGAGKSTIAEMLAESMGCIFVEADNFHSQANKEKMSKGIPLTDEDRIPWLESLRDAVREHIDGGKTVTLSCSALQKKHRDILRSADQEYIPGKYTNCVVKFVFLDAPAQVIAERINRRFKEGKHFMPVVLLQSQLDLLHIDEIEGIFRVDGSQSPQAIVDSILSKNTELKMYVKK